MAKKVINIDHEQAAEMIRSASANPHLHSTADVAGGLRPQESDTPVAPPRKEIARRNRGNAGISELPTAQASGKARLPVYISLDIHAEITRMVKVLSLASREINVGSYIDKILSEHIDQQRDAINDLYRQELEKYCNP